MNVDYWQCKWLNLIPKEVYVRTNMCVSPLTIFVSDIEMTSSINKRIDSNDLTLIPKIYNSIMSSTIVSEGKLENSTLKIKSDNSKKKMDGNKHTWIIACSALSVPYVLGLLPASGYLIYKKSCQNLGRVSTDIESFIPLSESRTEDGAISK